MVTKLKIYFLIHLGYYQAALRVVEKLNLEDLNLVLIKCYLLAATQKIDEINILIHKLKRENSLIFPEWQLMEAYLYLLDNNKKEAIFIYSDLIKNKFYKRKVAKIIKIITRFDSSEQILLNTSFKDFLEVKKIKSSKYFLLLYFFSFFGFGYFAFIFLSNSFFSKDYFFHKQIIYSQQIETNINFSQEKKKSI